MGMPHVCGDEPNWMMKSAGGYSVCPTYVGMNRKRDRQPGFHGGMPHVCGDEPPPLPHVVFPSLYAPRMWG